MNLRISTALRVSCSSIRVDISDRPATLYATRASSNRSLSASQLAYGRCTFSAYSGCCFRSANASSHWFCCTCSVIRPAWSPSLLYASLACEESPHRAK